MPSEESLPLQRLSGLRPPVWLSVGAGFAREDVKALLLSQGLGFVGQAVLNLQEFCIKLTGIAAKQVLSPFARQEVLRTLLAEPKILEALTELKRLKRQRNFIQRLDEALQTGRMAFAHAEEESVFLERLFQSFGENPLRDQLRSFSLAYETWLTATSNWDSPMLIRKAIEILQEGWPTRIHQPGEEIWVLAVQAPESLEREFWERVAPWVQVRRISSLVKRISEAPLVEWQKWHTLDDAAEFLADQLSQANQETGVQAHAVLLPDVPSIRRSLRRAFGARGLLLADPRDPTQLLWDESFKWAVLPLEVVARNYERQKVLSWLRTHPLLVEGAVSGQLPHLELSSWTHEINSRGIRQGLGTYSGGALAGVHSRLKELETLFGGRQTCQELSEKFLKHLKVLIGTDSEKHSLLSFFEQLWKLLNADLERVEAVDKKAPALYWLERLQSRLGESSPPVERLKPKEGIRLYRLQQAPVVPAEKLWIFGLPAHWLSSDGSGSLWFSERDREVLSFEFAVRSSAQLRAERLAVLSDWIGSASQVVLLDSHYTTEGREVESLFPVLKELELSLEHPFSTTPKDCGAHPRFSQSYQITRPIPPQEIQLSALLPGPGNQPPEITATTLDRYSRCSFQALTYHRWKLRDIREPDTELWPEVRGNIMHEAVRLLLRSLNAEGGFSLLPQEAMERGWKIAYPGGPKGLVRSPRIENYVKSRMVRLLEVFVLKEREYLDRSGALPVSLDETPVVWRGDGISVIGKPDRIDRHSEGLFIIDYKTSGSVPHGTDMLEWGYRLQLPFYALAVRQEAQQAILGVQFVELDRRGSRKSGVFFTDYNGKEEGRLTNVRSVSKSLLSISPEEAWDQLEEQVLWNARSYANGIFEAKPKLPNRSKECSQCQVADLCGYRRRVELDSPLPMTIAT